MINLPQAGTTFFPVYLSSAYEKTLHTNLLKWNSNSRICHSLKVVFKDNGMVGENLAGTIEDKWRNSGNRRKIGEYQDKMSGNKGKMREDQSKISENQGKIRGDGCIFCEDQVIINKDEGLVKYFVDSVKKQEKASVGQGKL